MTPAETECINDEIRKFREAHNLSHEVVEDIGTIWVRSNFGVDDLATLSVTLLQHARYHIGASCLYATVFGVTAILSGIKWSGHVPMIREYDIPCLQSVDCSLVTIDLSTMIILTGTKPLSPDVRSRERTPHWHDAGSCRFIQSRIRHNIYQLPLGTSSSR